MWTHDAGTKDLGAVDGDTCSVANAINSEGQIVGVSRACDFSVLNAFLWENGSIVDLSALVPPNSALHLTEAFAINDRGEITGVGVPSGCSAESSCGHARAERMMRAAWPLRTRPPCGIRHLR